MPCLLVKAQDPHFSQYFSSPMTLNPALIGKDIADWRVLANFRSQWWGSTDVAPFTTTSISLEKSYHKGTTGKNTLGIGLALLSDASNSGLLKNNYFTLGMAYNMALDANGDQQLGLGLEGSYANRIIDGGKFEFQSQFGSMGFQRSAPSGDPVNILSNNYFDMNVGLYYSRTFPAKRWGYRLGAAMYHAGTPKEGVFSNSTYTINRRFSLQGGLIFRTQSGEMTFSFISEMQGPNNIYTLGGVYKMKTNDPTIESLNFGLWNRFNDAFYPYLGLEGKNWIIGLSYDVVNADISAALNSVQSMELSLAWHFNSAKRKNARSVNALIY